LDDRATSPANVSALRRSGPALDAYNIFDIGRDEAEEIVVVAERARVETLDALNGLMAVLVKREIRCSEHVHHRCDGSPRIAANEVVDIEALLLREGVRLRDERDGSLDGGLLIEREKAGAGRERVIRIQRLRCLL